MRTQVALVGGFYCYAPAESLDLIADAWDLAALERSGASAAREPLVSTARRSVRVWNRPPPDLGKILAHADPSPHDSTCARRRRVRVGAQPRHDGGRLPHRLGRHLHDDRDRLAASARGVLLPMS